MSFNNLLKRNLLLLTALLIPFTFILSSCDDDDSAFPDPTVSNEPHVNNCILETIDTRYLWTNELTGNPNMNQNPDDFFHSLLSDDDRFSWLQENYEDLLNSLQGINKESGFEYVLYKEDDSNNVIAQILYVKPSSPAEAKGLKRGDVITHVNGLLMTTSNYQSVLGSIGDSFSITYRPLDIEQQAFDEPANASLTSVVYSENPNYLSKVIEVDGRKIGYYVYNFFSPGTDDQQNKYDQEMAQVFAGFKAKGITNLVIDFRFNSGGSEISANNLASLIAPNPDNKVFFRREFNSKVEHEILADPNAGEEFLYSRLKTKAENVGNNLGGKVYVLTSSRTASASELIINGLRPYMDVILIGDVTYGKNVGSISLYDEDDPRNTWGMQPIVLKVYNSQNQSEYGEGFTPDIQNKDNDVYLYPLGDVRENLLSVAIEQITGIPAVGRKAEIAGKELIGHSLDKKQRSFNLTVKDPRKIQ